MMFTLARLLSSQRPGRASSACQRRRRLTSCASRGCPSPPPRMRRHFAMPRSVWHQLKNSLRRKQRQVHWEEKVWEMSLKMMASVPQGGKQIQGKICRAASRQSWRWVYVRRHICTCPGVSIQEGEVLRGELLMLILCHVPSRGRGVPYGFFPGLSR